ncbi:MAG: hypothetical protein DRJ40_08830 [Thermoprotei archaeon]|nr:MAG: hypothetical protein DRJ40_08830 [Thermoprotei archaeon]
MTSSERPNFPFFSKILMPSNESTRTRLVRFLYLDAITAILIMVFASYALSYIPLIASRLLATNQALQDMFMYIMKNLLLLALAYVLVSKLIRVICDCFEILCLRYLGTTVKFIQLVDRASRYIATRVGLVVALVYTYLRIDIGMLSYVLTGLAIPPDVLSAFKLMLIPPAMLFSSQIMIEVVRLWREISSLRGMSSVT